MQVPFSLMKALGHMSVKAMHGKSPSNVDRKPIAWVQMVAKEKFFLLPPWGEWPLILLTGFNLNKSSNNAAFLRV